MRWTYTQGIPGTPPRDEQQMLHWEGQRGEQGKLKIMFICTGNTCRSPMAKALMERAARDLKVQDKIICDSAGLAAAPRRGANQTAILAAQELGMDLTGHCAKQATPQMLLEMDAVAVMTPDQYAFLKEHLPQMEGKIYLPEKGIPDPFGGTLEDYRRCLDRLNRWVRKLLLELLEKEKGQGNV